VAHVIRAGGDVIVRLNSANFPLLDTLEQPFELLPHLRKLRRHIPGEWEACFQVGDERFPSRLCAVRKTRAAAEKAKEQARREASRKGKQIREETLECAEYVFVLTTLPRSEFSTADILDLYRVRWQIELVFKRLKSLLRLGHLPKQNDLSARAWIQAKLLTALLIEHLADKARFFSPWGFDFEAPQSLA
jgi:IS4 transposase